MNERRAKLCHWAGANTGLREQQTSISSEQPGQPWEGQSASQSCYRGILPIPQALEGKHLGSFHCWYLYTVAALTGNAVKSD